MKPLQTWLDEYGESHRNATNKIIHWICVPLIFWSIVALLWSIPIPAFLVRYGGNWAYLALAAALIYYVFLSTSLAIGMLLIAYGMVFIADQLYIDKELPALWQIALTVFVLAWIGQFIGHKIEGRKPSFLKDVQFLLIGPIWLLHFIYRRMGIPV